MISFKAAVLREIGKDPNIEEVFIKEPLKGKQVLVKIHYSGICGKQLEEISGHFGEDKYLPHMIGHEGLGEIIEIGPKVNDLKVGQKVILHWMDSYEDNETPLPNYFQGDSKINAGYLVTFSEYCITKSSKLTPIRKTSIELEKNLFLLGCGLTTGIGCVLNESNVTKNDHILVVGLGGVGLSILVGLSLKGIINFDILELKKEAHLRASFYKPKSSYFNIEDIKKNYNKIFYCIGSETIFPKVYNKLSTNGVIYMVGVPSKNAMITIPLLSIHQKKMLTGSFGGLIKPRKDIPKFIDMIDSGLINLNNLVGEQFPLSNIKEALNCARENTGRVSLKCKQ